MNVRNSMLWFLMIVTIIFLYSGYFESKCDYTKKYYVTYGKIIDSKIEIMQTREPNAKVGCIGVYAMRIKYRLRVEYEYIIKGKTYSSYFYNDDVSDEYIENMNKIGLLNNKYKIGRIIKIYTNIKNNAESCINIKNMRRKKSLFYYSCSVMSFIVSLIILFFSDFFINE